MGALRKHVLRMPILASVALLASLLAFPDVASATSAQFGRRSYRPGETAILNVTSNSVSLTVQVFRVGREAAGHFRIR